MNGAELLAHVASYLPPWELSFEVSNLMLALSWADVAHHGSFVAMNSFAGVRSPLHAMLRVALT